LGADRRPGLHHVAEDRDGGRSIPTPAARRGFRPCGLRPGHRGPLELVDRIPAWFAWSQQRMDLKRQVGRHDTTERGRPSCRSPRSWCRPTHLPRPTGWLTGSGQTATSRGSIGDDQPAWLARWSLPSTRSALATSSACSPPSPPDRTADRCPRRGSTAEEHPRRRPASCRSSRPHPPQPHGPDRGEHRPGTSRWASPFPGWPTSCASSITCRPGAVVPSVTPRRSGRTRRHAHIGGDLELPKDGWGRARLSGANTERPMTASNYSEVWHRARSAVWADDDHLATATLDDLRRAAATMMRRFGS